MKQALLAVAILLLGAIGLSLLANIATTAMIAGYLCLAVAYSRFLKRIVLLDAFLLAMFYIIRIFAGGLAVSVPVSFWTLLFSMFIFLSLAFVKRFAELSNMQNAGRTAAIGRG
jgi:4-hydroxybenzoate polyprenyltransferase